MPLAAIPGFIKKRSASQQYRRSPRQLTRDITVALEMRDETVLPHVCIRNEDGSVIEGTEITTDMVKELRGQGRNPMWYLRRTWLEQTYGLRGSGDQPAREDSEFEDEDEPVKSEDSPAEERTVAPDLVQLMQESIRELKTDKVMLTEQLKIKDEQIRETTERWKESNYISQGLNQRLEAMEKRFELNTRLLQEVAPKSPPFSANSPVVEPVPEPKAEQPGRSEFTSEKSKPAKPKRGVIRKQPVKVTQPKKSTPPKWYEMPTLKRLFHGDK